MHNEMGYFKPISEAAPQEKKKTTVKDRRKTYFLEQCIRYSPIRKKKPLPSIYYIKNLIQGIDDNKP